MDASSPGASTATATTSTPSPAVFRDKLAGGGEGPAMRMFRRHSSWYTKGFRGSAKLRARLMQAPYKSVSADSNAIRQWFHGQVEFAPPLPAISQTQYAFLGVRLNYFLDRRVAEIGYASRTHVLSFLMFPDKGLSLQTLRQVQAGARTFYVQSYKGYNAVLWEDGAVFCSLVSDLHMDELVRVARQALGQNPAL